MVFPPDGFESSGPPPQSVLDQRWLWHCLMLLLVVTFDLRLLGLDVAGALLTGLMLCFAVAMTRDGMREMSRYSLVFAVLCSLNFFFDFLPLLTELGGRVQRSQMPGATEIENGVARTTITVVVKRTDFFDRDMGFVYNVQSLSMLVAPIAMALGMYLAISAHNASAPWADDSGFGLDARAPIGAAASASSNFGAAGSEAAADGGGERSGAGPAGAGAAGFNRFQGASYKLST